MRDLVILLRAILEKPGCTQREIGDVMGISLGKVNKLVHEAVSQGLLLEEENDVGRGRNVSFVLADEGRRFLQKYKVDAALVLASGFGSRFVPLTYEMPKGLLPVFGERMIERQIRQLHEVGITDITIMVGYLKEKFDYLIDKYGVKLLYNPEYASKNTLATMVRAEEVLRGKNCYILSSDNWMRDNMYHLYEADSWYAATFMHGETKEWVLEAGKNGGIKSCHVGGKDQWCMYGPVYFTKAFSEKFLPLLKTYYRMPGTEQMYWEDVLIRNLNGLPAMYINKQPDGEVYEFENLEELRQFDEEYVNHSGSKAMEVVSHVFKIPEADIVGIKCLKAGMTNKSFLFTVREDSAEAKREYRGKAFICRIPGPGTEKMINRQQEYEVYKAVTGLGITEELVYFNPETGYKISRYYEGAHNADYGNPKELRQCMGMLKLLHNSGVTVPHDFSIEQQLRLYEKDIRDIHQEVMFEDYPEVRMKAAAVFDFVAGFDRPKTIAHIDSVSDNFIFTKEGLRMIDWEYCGMADPLIDLAMAAIYSYMSFDEAKRLMEIYQEAPMPASDIIAGATSHESAVKKINAERNETGQSADGGIAFRDISKEDARLLVIAYMGLGGLLWAVWCSYKISLGENFGDYTLKMYRYFKDSYQILRNSGKI